MKWWYVAVIDSSVECIGVIQINVVLVTGEPIELFRVCAFLVLGGKSTTK